MIQLAVFARANRLFDACPTHHFHLGSKLMYDARRYPRPVINQPRIYLNQRRARGDFFPGVLGIKYSSHTDYRKAPMRLTVQMANDISAPLS